MRNFVRNMAGVPFVLRSGFEFQLVGALGHQKYLEIQPKGSTPSFSSCKKTRKGSEHRESLPPCSKEAQQELIIGLRYCLDVCIERDQTS